MRHQRRNHTNTSKNFSIDIACAAIARIRQIGKLMGSFTIKSVDAPSNLATQSGPSTGSSTLLANAKQSSQQGTVLTKATKQDYEEALVDLIGTLNRFTVAFPFLSLESVKVLEELKTNFRNDDTIRQAVHCAFTDVTQTIIDNAKK